MARRLYLDSNIFADALEVPSSAQGGLLDAATSGDFEVVLSDLLLEEVRDLVGRLHGRSSAFQAAMMLVELPLRRFVADVEWRRGMSAVKPFVRGEADGPHLAAAFVSRCDAFVSRNRRSVLPGIFDVVPLVSPEAAWQALSGSRPWPTRDEALHEWEEWARRSSRAPKRSDD
jgi:hypothetical protein